MSGGGGKQTTNTVAQPWEGAQDYLHQLLGTGSALSKEGVDYSKEYVGMTPGQLDAIENIKRFYGQGGAYEQALGQGRSTLEQMLMAPETAPTSAPVQAMIQAGQQGLSTQLAEEIMPQIRSGASAAGQYGSTRQGVAEGVAIGKTQQAQADLATEVMGQAYQEGLKQRTIGMGMLPQMLQMEAQPAQAMASIEDMLRGEQQSEADVDYWNRVNAQWAPIERWANLLLPAAGLGGRRQTTTSGGGTSTAGRLLGSGMTGLGAYSTLAGLGAGSMAMPIGVGAGLLSMLA